MHVKVHTRKIGPRTILKIYLMVNTIKGTVIEKPVKTEVTL